MGEPYLWRTANMSRRTCVVVKQMQFNPIHGLTLIPAWIGNCIHYNVWHEMPYPFSNFNSAAVEVKEKDK